MTTIPTPAPSTKKGRSFRVWPKAAQGSPISWLALWLGRFASKAVLGVLAAMIAVLLWAEWQSQHTWGQYRNLLNDALVNTQRLAWSATLSPSEDAGARQALIESKQRLAQLFSILINGGRLDGKEYQSLPPKLQANFAEASRWWFKVERAATTLVTGQYNALPDPRLKTLRDSVDRFASRYDSWVDPKRSTTTAQTGGSPGAAIPAQTPGTAAPQTPAGSLTASAAQTALALNTAVLIERLSHMLTAPMSRTSSANTRYSDVTQIPSLLERIQSQVEALLNGDATLGVKPAAGGDREKLLGFRADVALLVKLGAGVRESLPLLGERLQTARAIGSDADTLRRQLQSLQPQLHDPDQVMRWGWLAVLALAFVALSIARTRYLVAEAEQQVQAMSQDAALTMNQAFAHGEMLDLKREGAETALRGVLSALRQTAETTRAISERTELTARQQAQQLDASGRAFIALAGALHGLALQTTEAAKTALRSQQDALLAEPRASHALTGWESLRDDIRKSASGLKKAGESSRQLADILADLPAEHQARIEPVIQQTREALREAVSGLVAGTQRIAQGQAATQALALTLTQNQTAWLGLVEKLETCTGGSAAQAQVALALARVLLGYQGSDEALMGIDNDSSANDQQAEKPKDQAMVAFANE